MLHPPKITPCLWFEGNAEEAVEFYSAIFKSSKVHEISRYPDAGREIHGGRPGQVLTVSFELDGQRFTALNAGPEFKFTEAISFQVDCRNQDEVDYYWSRLGAGGDERAQQCGWLKDRFGVSWQIVPRAMMEMLMDPDREKAGRAMKAMMGMKKLDIATLERAYAGSS